MVLTTCRLWIWAAIGASMWSAVACVHDPPPRLALGGVDVIECADKQLQNAGVNCTAVGSSQWSTELDSVDNQGNLLYASTFYFESEDNMIGFENAPVAFTPQFGGECGCVCVCVCKRANDKHLMCFGIYTHAGFCAYALSAQNATALWSRTVLGPNVDVSQGWRVIDGSVYLFSSASAAGAFEAGLPHSLSRAQTLWAKWFGKQGGGEFAVVHGPLNYACFAPGQGGRDCAKQPQMQPLTYSHTHADADALMTPT
jgi:YHS domain-containing protein